jgi:hypothetical protein
MGPDMIERHKRRLGGVVVLLAAAAVGGATGVFADTSTRQLVTGLIAFGLVNALVEVPGTWGVRAITIGTIAVSLVLQGESRTFAVSATLFMAWLVWPPAFLVAWALNREATATNERLAVRTSGHARIGVTAIIAAIVIGTVAYRLIFIHRLEQTAALFIGLPALMAVIVVWATSPRSATGVACKAVTIGLLISMIFLGEGMVCVAMSAPLFYGVAVLIGRSVDELRRRDRSTTLSVIVLLAFVPMSLEGVTRADLARPRRDHRRNPGHRGIAGCRSPGHHGAPAIRARLAALPARGISASHRRPHRAPRREPALGDSHARR